MPRPPSTNLTAEPRRQDRRDHPAHHEGGISMKGCWMAESLDDDRRESYNDTSCVAPSKYAVPRISLPQPHNYESDSHSHEPQSHVDQRKYRHLADSTPLSGYARDSKKFPQRNYCSVLLGISTRCRVKSWYVGLPVTWVLG